MNGKYRTWTKRLGTGSVKVLLLQGGPGASHEYLEAMEFFLPQAGIGYVLRNKFYATLLQSAGEFRSQIVKPKWIQTLNDVIPRCSYEAGSSWLPFNERSRDHLEEFLRVVSAALAAMIARFAFVLWRVRRGVEEKWCSVAFLS